MNDPRTPSPQPLRLCILPDFAEEDWPSMDLCAEMLASALGRRDDVAADVFAPRYVRRFGRRWRNANRLVNRLREYPRQLRRDRVAGKYDAFHVVDHSYAQLARGLPVGRVGVFCHDLDTFRCLLEPHRDPRPAWFRWMTRRILHGLQRAAVVFHATDAVRAEIERFALVDPARLVKAPLGIAPEFRPRDVPRGDPPFVLHVGSCIPRKRIDVLLATFAAVAPSRPGLRLVQVGGKWDEPQRALVRRIGDDRVVQRRGVSREALAELYSSAALVMLPSEAEGFGLPLVEAIACGATVLASDLPVLREVAGDDAAVFAPVGDVEAWADAATALLDGRGVPSDQAKQRRAALYSWDAHAATIVSAYRRLIG